MKVWVSKHPCCCRTPTPAIETPMVDHQDGVGGPPWVFHQVVWVCDSNMGASTPALSYNSPPTHMPDYSRGATTYATSKPYIFTTRRGNRGGGGEGSEDNLSPKLESRVCAALPPTSVKTVNTKSDYFWQSRELGSLPKLVGRIRGVFSFG